ncbi:MAG: hypothetical protein GX410_09810 [Elusimicrobia bacterium]|nr:hypothetical protein [Elusimicrobiota bacterium]
MLPEPLSLKRRVIRGYDFDRVRALINPRMLYNKHLGLKKPVERLLSENDARAVKLAAQVESALELARECARLDCVYSFFYAESKGDSILFYGETPEPSEFPFPRQSSGEKLCLSDFVRPPSGGRRDAAALFVCTAGAKIIERAGELREKGDYVLSHLLNISAICLAEALAEAVHSDIRREWKLPDTGAGSPEDLLRQRYTGRRFSFGYPACPGLENQAELFRLLKPEEIGVSLTESFMMSPEDSVSALLLPSPDARYFEII